MSTTARKTADIECSVQAGNLDELQRFLTHLASLNTPSNITININVQIGDTITAGDNSFAMGRGATATVNSRAPQYP